MGVEYDGANYSGWQRQSNAPSVQQHVEKAISRVANTELTVQCAGRTDAGVHATGQVVHFDCPVDRPDRGWTLGVNTNLPSDVSIRWVKTLDDSFHARFSAVARRYRYIIFNHPFRPAIMSSGITHVYTPLDHEKMHEAAQCLVGEHDFSAFRASMCQAHSPVRRLSHISVKRQGEYIFIDVQANAFVHHMVRNITGSLLVVGSGEQGVEWMSQVLAGRDRKVAGTTAKPNGLYLVDVIYPESFGLPRPSIGPVFLA